MKCCFRKKKRKKRGFAEKIRVCPSTLLQTNKQTSKLGGVASLVFVVAHKCKSLSKFDLIECCCCWLVGLLQHQQQQQQKHALFANSLPKLEILHIFLFPWECVHKKNYLFHSTRVLLTVLGPFVI